MDEKREIGRVIGAYLAKVAEALGDTPAEEKETILETVESHIYEALERSASEEPALADLALVMAEMAPPAAYAREKYADASGTPSSEPQLCRLAVLGAFVAMLGLVVGGFLYAFAQDVYTLFASAGVWGLSIVLPIASIMMGLAAISKIRASGGRLIGLPLAVGITLFYPLATLTSLCCALGVAAVVLFEELDVLNTNLHQLLINVPLLVVLGLLVLLADAAAVRRVWRWATRPPTSGEFV